MNIESSHDAPSDWMIHSRIKGLVALVVGAGSGMGEASAKTFAANGGAVAVADLNVGHAERVAGEIVRHGGEAIALGLDVSKQPDIDAAIAATVERFGRLDVVINTAALVRAGMLEDVPIEEWRAGFQVNVDGALMLARSAAKKSAHRPSSTRLRWRASTAIRRAARMVRARRRSLRSAGRWRTNGHPMAYA